VGFRVAKFAKPQDALNALTSGQIQAIVAVGGAPLPFVNEFGQAAKLIPFTERVANRVKGVYNTGAKLNYTNVTNGMGVSTVSTNALFVVQDYKRSQTMIQSLAALRTCVLENLGDLQETTGMHPKWKLVSEQQATDAAYRGKWTWYEFTTVNTTKRK
jgi:TRAP-type uncharacterized transport system substrate-binding protein